MSEKSHVSMGQHQCPACGRMRPSNEILLDKRMRNSLERYTTTGVSPCPECSKEGFVLLVGATKTCDDGGFKTTGDVAHLKLAAWERVFPGKEVPPGGWSFCDPLVIERLRDAVEKPEAQP